MIEKVKDREYAVKARIYDSEGRAATIDLVSGLLITLPGEHARIHDGYAFIGKFDIGDLAQGAEAVYSFKTPEAIQIHLQNIVLAAANADVAVGVYRGTEDSPLEVTVAGSEDSEIIGPHSLNDASEIVSGVVIRKSPTYSGGELWDRLALPGAGTNQFQSVGVRSDSPYEEYLMKENTYYVIKVVNEDSSNAAIGVSVRLFWYGREPL